MKSSFEMHCENSFKLGGAIGHRVLYIYLLIDSSQSMSTHGKNQSVNYAGAKILVSLRGLLHEHPALTVEIVVITFDASAKIHNHITDIKNATWHPVGADGVDTRLSPALDLLAEQMPGLEGRKLYAPLFVVVSDGLLGDRNFNGSLQKVLSTKWGQRAVRIAIAIDGNQGEHDIEPLRSFMSTKGHEPLIAADAEQLAQYIDWAVSTMSSSIVMGNDDTQVWPNQSTIVMGGEDVV